MTWDYTKYGTASDPVHKSALNVLTGAKHGCPRRYQYLRDADLGGREQDASRAVDGRACAGNAAHAVIEGLLLGEGVVRDLLTARWKVDPRQIAELLAVEFRRESQDREVSWYGADERAEMSDRALMVAGLLNDLHRHVSEIIAVESGFIARVGEYWVSGHVDLIFRPCSEPDTLAIADWKSGKEKPHPIELAHGWEGGIYAAAMLGGWFLSSEEAGRSLLMKYIKQQTSVTKQRAVEEVMIRFARDVDRSGDLRDDSTSFETYAAFPSQIWHVHMRDYVPYARAGKRELKRAEDVAHYGLSLGSTVKYQAGDQRGPAWLPVGRREQDLPRLEHQVRAVVEMVRAGHLIERVGERCARCPYAAPCLNAGYEVRGAERAELDAAIDGLDGDGFSD